MANQEQLAIIKQGVSWWNEWRQNNPDAVIDLSGDLLPLLAPGQLRVAPGCWVDKAAMCAGVR